MYIHIYILLHVCALCLSIYSGSGPIFFWPGHTGEKTERQIGIVLRCCMKHVLSSSTTYDRIPNETGQAKDSPEEHFHDVWRNWGSANGQAGRRTREDQTGKELRCVHNHLFWHPSSWLDLASSSLIHMRSKLWQKKMLTEYRLVNCQHRYSWCFPNVQQLIYIGDMQAMTCFEDLPADERKRQREALWRKMMGPGRFCRVIFPNSFWLATHHVQIQYFFKHSLLACIFMCMSLALATQGLKPGLLQKFNAAHTPDQKFAFLKAFMLDPSMNSVEVESEYVDMSVSEDRNNWVQLPLAEIRKKYNTDADKAFIDQVIAQQIGTNHPQDPNGEFPDWKLYWIFKEGAESHGSNKHMNHCTVARSHVPANKAANQSMADHLTTVAAGFGGKGPTMPTTGKGAGPQTSRKGKGKGSGKAASKANKAGHTYHV